MRLGRALVAAAVAAALLPRVADATPPRGSLTPAAQTLALEAGQARTLDYALRLPAQPMRPTDLYLLVDGSASMQPYLEGLRRGLTGALRPLAARDVRVGVGEFRTTSLPDRHAGRTYRGLRKVGPVDGELVQAVDRVGRDQETLSQVLPGDHAHTVALDQSVTGNGDRWHYVGAGQDAGFRPRARKIVAVVTAAAFAADQSQPSRAEAVAALRAAGAEVFGLALHGDALSDLTAVAQGTGGVTDTTVDCGAGRRVPAGRPAACVVSPGAVGGALTGMLYERRRGDVTVKAAGYGVRGLSRRAFSVDLNRPSVTRLRLAVACAAGEAGAYDIRLTASSAGAVVAQAVLTLRCGVRPAPARR